MPTALSTPPAPTTRVEAPSRAAAPVVGRTLGSAIATASDAVIGLPLHDPRWTTVGPVLTAFVDAAWRCGGEAGSPVGAHEEVPPVLRLRDLGRLAQRTVASRGHAMATAEVDHHLRSLQVAVDCRPSDA